MAVPLAQSHGVEVELWSRDGVRLADITHLVRNYHAVEERNEAEQLQFSLDLDEFERYMIEDAGLDPVSNFRDGQTEIIVRENGKYRFGTQLQWAPINLNRDGSATVSVNAVGYLNFFNTRMPSPNIRYNQVEAVEIARDLIRKSQQVTLSRPGLPTLSGDHGIVLPTSGYYTTGIRRDREYREYTETVKLAIQRLTALKDGNFDFKFREGKEFMTYKAIGSPRTDFTITYDRTHNHSTFVEAVINRGSNQMNNYIIGMGSGNGEETITETVFDAHSINEFGLREGAHLFNNVSNRATLRENAEGRLKSLKDLIRLPQITLSGADLPETPLEVGDIVYTEYKGRRLLEDASGWSRIERMETTYDDRG